MYLSNLMNEWLEIYESLDHRTKEAKSTKRVIIKLFNMLGGDING